MSARLLGQLERRIVAAIALSIIAQTANAALIAPKVINSGDESILEGSFTNPNFTVFNTNNVAVSFGAINLLTSGTEGDPTDFATGTIAKTGSCFAGFPTPVILQPNQFCDFDISVTAAPFDPTEIDMDTGITTFTAFISWLSEETTQSSLRVEVRDPGAVSRIPEPGTFWLVCAGVLLTIGLSYRMQKI